MTPTHNNTQQLQENHFSENNIQNYKKSIEHMLNCVSVYKGDITEHPNSFDKEILSKLLQLLG